MKVELDPQPRVRVVPVAVVTMHPQTDCPVDLGNTDGHVDTMTMVEVTLECAGLDGSEEGVLDVDSDLIETSSVLGTDVDLAGELWRRQKASSYDEMEGEGASVAYLEGERTEGDANVGVDVLVLAAEDRILGDGEDMVLVLVVGVGTLCDGVVDHEPVVHICTLKIRGLSCTVSV